MAVQSSYYTRDQDFGYTRMESNGDQVSITTNTFTLAWCGCRTRSCLSTRPVCLSFRVCVVFVSFFVSSCLLGSGQQSVTGFEGSDDPNSLWQVKSAFTKKAPTRVFTPGTPIKCGEMIRLQHATTKKWLHSHLHVSPLSKRQEISGYGEDDGTGSDSGDNWKIECAQGAVDWMRDGQANTHTHTRIQAQSHP